MASREQVFPGQPPIFGGGRLLPSPSQFFLTGEDRLRIVSANSVAGVSLKVQWRTAIPGGDVVPNSQSHTPNSDRTVKQQDFELGSGSLLNVTVFAGAGAPLIGQTYVMVQIIRGEGLAAIVLGTILAGYVTAVQALGFPGSPIMSSTDGEPFVRTITGTAPGAGLNFGESCPTGARWEILRVMNQLTTSVAAANRYAQFRVVQNGVRTVTVDPAGAAGAASQWDYMWAPNLTPVAALTGTVYQQPFPDRLLLVGGDFFFSSTTNLQAGDVWAQPMYVVREWLEVS